MHEVDSSHGPGECIYISARFGKSGHRPKAIYALDTPLSDSRRGQKTTAGKSP